MTTRDLSRRVSIVRAQMAAKHVDALLVTDEANVSYLSGFAGHDSSLVITKKEKFFITDSRFIEDAAETVKGYDLILAKQSTYESVLEIARRTRIGRIGFESMNLPHAVALRLRKTIAGVKTVPLTDIVEKARIIKDAGETALIRSAVRLTRRVMASVASMVRAGVTESQLAGRAKMEFIKHGADPAFESIVATSANSSKPHARPGRARITKNGFVMIDLGAKLGGYCADITRMVMIGDVPGRIKKIYSVVSMAQNMAIDIIRPGARISDIDRAARKCIEKAGFGGCFGHSLGHGVGMEVHEAPSISPLNDGRLAKGMVFTVEPAIYLPKVGGVRIEDMVLVTDDGCEVLTR